MKTVMVILINLLVFAINAYADPAEQGRISGAQALERIGTIEKLKENVVTPMTGGNDLPVQSGERVMLNTPCPSSTRFLEVSVGSAGSGGDITSVYIRQDTNFDGVIDYSFYAPVPRISGVCADGVISCNAGTWSGCSYHQWTADTSGRMTTVILLENKLKECYCVNDSCGSGVVNENLLRITSDLSSGIVDALHAANPKLAISDSSLTPGEAVYSAKNVADDSCKSDYEFTIGPDNLYDRVTGAVGPVNEVKVNTNEFAVTRNRTDRITATTRAASDSSSTTLYYEDDLDAHTTTLVNENAYGKFTPCEKACKVKRTIKDTQASTAGHTALFRFNTLEADFALRKCKNDRCQLEPGDEIEVDCSCLNEFNTVFPLMALLEGAAKTVICSSGMKQ